jgi:mono/diheme cytochrome c family protein
MREYLARWVAGVTLVLVLSLAAVFAWVQNPRPTAPPPETPVAEHVDPERAAAGREVYEAQQCSRCHAIAGEGNPRSPLDGVGARHDAAEMRDWIVGADTVDLSARVRGAKADYLELSDAELEALVAYMLTL